MKPKLTVVKKEPDTKEYLVIADRNSKILLSTTEWSEAVKCANLCRRASGEVTIFKSTKG